MSLILSLVALAITVANFAWLARLNSRSTRIGKLHVKVDAAEFGKRVAEVSRRAIDEGRLAADLIGDLSNRIATAQRVERDSEKSGSPRPGSPPCAN